MADRLADTQRFYELLDRLEGRIGGRRMLADCVGSMNWPNRGVYFFYEDGEVRSRSGAGSRIVRVGTHGLKTGSRSTLWAWLKQHRGPASTGGGNHRGSIFRKLVGVALARHHDLDAPRSWGVGADLGVAARRLGADRGTVKRAEAELEARVSRHIRAMPFLWLDVGDEPGPRSKRGMIERNTIALLSGYRGSALDPPSAGWLGRSSDRWRVRRSGLWNNNHVDEDYTPTFLDAMERQIGGWRP